ncbi:MAG: hypothetical protein JW833_13680 [Prolixibacteraceae bacterium]|nr:hypothetical protein [Prolixibacteraceae bacterium]
MQFITISEELKSKVSEVELHVIECNVEVMENNHDLWNVIEKEILQIRKKLSIEEISQIPEIQSSRKAYKACGKDPARYRLSSEALLRRVVKGSDLYRINNVVDQLNLVSITTGYSIGGYDADKINGSVEFGIGKADEPYTGIGRGELNIEGLPVFRDSIGAFGTPTSDSERTMVTGNTKKFMMVIIGYGANERLEEATEMAVSLLKQFATASGIEVKVIK